MPPTHLVVDGSNIATEGRSLPSLQQLLEAVDAVTAEFDHANVTVIVDATFGHRIDASEREQYEEKVNSGQIITPPAGVIGRGDAFILEVADRADAIILSNDSFQEFHGTYDWLFQEGRLLGGKHVPGVGWIFLARSPVRGPTSRRAVSDAKRKRRGSKSAASKTPASKRPSSSGTSKSSSGSKSSRSKSSGSKSSTSSARAKDKPKSDEPAGRKRGGKEPEPYNEPLPFIEFVGAHPVGSVIEAEVEQFASHGAYVVCDGTRAYISLKSISDPPPRSAREVLELGETREFVVKAIDTPRRGIDLAMPGMDLDVTDDDEPDEVTAEDAEVEATVEDDVTPTEPVLVAAQAPTEDDGDRKLSVSQRRKLRAQQQAEAAAAAEEAAAAPAKKAATRTRARAAAKKAAPDPKATDRKATSDMATKKAATKKKAAAKKAATKKKAAPAKKSAAKKSAAKKASAKKSTAKKSAAKKSTAKKAGAKKSTAKKSAAKKSTTKKAGAKKSAAKKSAAKKSGTKKSAAKKSATKRS